MAVEYDYFAEFLYYLFAQDKIENPMPAQMKTNLLTEICDILRRFTSD